MTEDPLRRVLGDYAFVGLAPIRLEPYEGWFRDSLRQVD